MRRAALALPLTALLLLSACGGDDNDSKASMDRAAPAATSAPASGNELGSEDEAGAKEGRPKNGKVISGRVQPAGDQIIKNARLAVAVTNVDAARDKAVGVAKGAGGDVSSEQRSGAEDARTATIVFRVPPSDFDSLVTELGKLGTVLDSTTETQDVTGEVADLRGRIGAAKDSAAKIRELIGKATAIGDIVTLEREYQARDAEIQSMTAQLTALEDRAGRSSVTLSLSVLTKAVIAEAKNDKASGFLDGLEAGWSAFTAATVVTLTVLGALLPFLVLAAIALAGWLASRRRRRARPVAPPPAPSYYATAGTGAGAPPNS
jgi:hypothetical protein